MVVSEEASYNTIASSILLSKANNMALQTHFKVLSRKMTGSLYISNST